MLAGYDFATQVRGALSLVLLAVKQNGLALKFASSDCKDDHEIAMAATQQVAQKSYVCRRA